MPVLGAAGDNPVPGVWLPAGWDTRARAKFATRAASRVECAFFGDSTTFGQTSAAEYSWVTRVRARSQADSIPDGGFGMVSSADTAALTGSDALIPLASATLWTQSDSDNAFLTSGYTTTTVGRTLTLQFKGTAFRIWYSLRDTAGTAGSFSVAVDGGTAVTVSTATTALAIDNYYVTGLTEGTHTVVVTYTAGTGAVHLTPEFLRSTGVTYHKQGVPGISSNSWFGPASVGNYRVAPSLGLDSAGAANSTPLFYRAQKTAGQYRNVALTAFHLGINDCQSSTTAVDADARSGDLAASIGLFAMGTKQANASGVVILPHYWAASGGSAYGGKFRRAGLAAALSYGLAVVDFSQPLGSPAESIAAGYGGASSNPHLNAAGYTVQGDLFYEQIIRRLL